MCFRTKWSGKVCFKYSMCQFYKTPAYATWFIGCRASKAIVKWLITLSVTLRHILWTKQHIYTLQCTPSNIPTNILLCGVLLCWFHCFQCDSYDPFIHVNTKNTKRTLKNTRIAWLMTLSHTYHMLYSFLLSALMITNANGTERFMLNFQSRPSVFPW